MTINFEDGSSIEASDWVRMLSIITQRSKEGKAAPTEIKQGGVTVKLNGLEINKNAKVAEHTKYVEGKYLGWKIRVWRIEKDEVYGVNYFKDEDVRYLEVPFNSVRDENGVFKYVRSFIDEI